RFGRTFLYWFGTRPRLAVVDPELVRAVLTDPTRAFEKVGLNPSARQLFGEGLKGTKWAHHRRVLTPAFNMERLKVPSNLPLSLSLSLSVFVSFDSYNLIVCLNHPKRLACALSNFNPTDSMTL
ncbi:hypothetical protein GW17_00035154, partial [Ensete ventricosum]